MALRYWALIGIALLLTACQSSGTSSTATTGTTAPVGVSDPWPAYARTPPVLVPASGDFRHERTGLIFPVTAGPFVREKIMRFDREGLDIAANYELPKTRRQTILVSVYLYPITGSMPDMTPARAANGEACLEEFRGVKTVAAHMFVNPQLVDERSVAAPHPDFQMGRMAVFDSDGGRNFPTFTGRVRSESYVFCGRNPLWVLKYRITYEQNAEVQTSLDALFPAVPR